MAGEGPSRDACVCAVRAFAEARLDAVLCVSACLVGKPCRFDATARPNPSVMQLADAVRAGGGRVQLVCPEAAARLPRPRPPAEIQGDGRVLSACGKDVSASFACGARATVDLVRKNGASLVVLKSKSPSCGVHEVYDGSFCDVLVPGMGKAAELLWRAGYCIVDELDVEKGFLFRAC